MKTKLLLYILIGIFCSFGFFSCSSDHDSDWTEEISVEVDSELVPYEIWEATVDGIRIRQIGTLPWHTIPVGSIEGFEFEEGYSYVLKIQVTHLADPPQDGSSIKRKLITIVSKNKNLPANKQSNILSQVFLTR